MNSQAPTDSHVHCRNAMNDLLSFDPADPTTAEGSDGFSPIVESATTPTPAESSPDISEPDTDSSDAGSPVRGRSLKIGQQHGLISRATTRRRAGPSSVEINGDMMQNRMTSRDFTAEPLEMDHGILEPYPDERVSTTMSQVLTRASTYGSSIDLTGFRGHRDTFALLDLPHRPRSAPDLPLEFFQSLVPLLDLHTYHAVRLSCRCWSAAISYVYPPKLPSVYFLPAEILEQVYYHLMPTDFNNARHTCRAWMLTSLESRLLSLMLKRGGWWAAVNADLELCHHLSTQRIGVNEEWLMSKRLATECSLGPNWTGNGLRTQKASTRTRTSLQDDIRPSPSLDTINQSGLILTSQTDFFDLSDGYSSWDNWQGSALHFTTSVCGRFVLVAEGCIIYVYRLQNRNITPTPYGGPLEPLTSIICPRRVLAVSMDTSSQRFAVAALLDDRMGLVCDLQDTAFFRRPSTLQGQTGTSAMPDYRASVSSSRSSGERIVTEQASLDRHGLANEHSWSGGGSSTNNEHAGRSADPLSCSSFSSDSLPTSSMPIETGPRSIYRNLCSIDDPPLSVAICPQRRCVAFGCSAGIELHWVDALTGQDLNRWFPLTAPSDFLYFLPPRRGVDSAKKLRLISSAAHPSTTGGLRGRFFTSGSGVYSSGMKETYLPATTDTAGIRSDSDHYRAVPLSDGHHILFTDPATGCLCLGHDAPVGAPTKLVRKIMMMGPEREGDEDETVVPSVYAAGGELRWGVRVVVGFGARVFLFCIPPDMFQESSDSESQQQDGLGHTEGEGNGYGSFASLWHIKIWGLEIGRLEGLVDVAVDSFPGSFTIWAFASNGLIHTWQMNNGTERRVRKRSVRRDGAVVDVEDVAGDLIMMDAPLLPHVGERMVGFDGASSSFYRAPNGSLVPSCGDFSDHVVESVQEIVMRDEDEGYWSDDSMAQTGRNFAIHVPPIDGRWSEGSADWLVDYLGDGQSSPGLDILELSRLECEVL
ncbi:hypothetical protein MMC24_004918 [Lignoscripta atroalba]|nr:hypothetical protein [Lignoscripta atroalba]